MARKRMIDPSIWTDDGMAELEPRQQLLYIGLFSNADDAGRVKGSPSAIRLILPVIYGGLDLAEIARDLDAVLGVMRQLRRYSVDGREYLVFGNYPQWQRIDKPGPSLLPEPPEQSESDQLPLSERSANDLGTVPPNRTEVSRREEKGSKENGSEARLRALDLVRTYGVSTNCFHESLKAFPEFDTADVHAIALDFVTYHTTGPPKKDKDRTWLNWLKKQREINERDAQQQSTNGLRARPADRPHRRDPASQIGADPLDASDYLAGLTPSQRAANERLVQRG